MTTYTWNRAANGDWTESGLWSPSGGPPDSAGADALVGVAGTYAVTADAGRSITLDSLTLAAAAATLDLLGTLDFVGKRTLTLGAGTLALGGTLKGATIAMAGGTIEATSGNGGTLDGVTLHGTLKVTGPTASTDTNVFIAGGISLAGESGAGAGAINIDGQSTLSAGVTMAVVGSTTLNNATITVANGDLVNDDIDGTGQTLTLGASLTLQLWAGGTLDAGAAPGDVIVNDGTIVDSALDGSGTIIGNSFVNNGTILDTDGISLGTSNFINNGTISADNGVALGVDQTFTNNGTVILTGVANGPDTLLFLDPGWHNDGTIILNDAGVYINYLSDSTTPWGKCRLVQGDRLLRYPLWSVYHGTAGRNGTERHSGCQRQSHQYGQHAEQRDKPDCG